MRKQSFGVGVERTFPLHSPKIERIEVAAIGDVSRAKLYYLRGKVGKKARVREVQRRGPLSSADVVEPGAGDRDEGGATAADAGNQGGAGAEPESAAEPAAEPEAGAEPEPESEPAAGEPAPEETGAEAPRV